MPDANIGVAAGRSGLVIIDVDVKKGGNRSLHQLANWFGEASFRNAPRVATPHGGCHLYYSDEGLRTVRSPIGVLPGIDIRAVGAYVVAPPSVLGDLSWRWDHGEGEEPPGLPDDLRQWIVDQRREKSKKTRLPDGPLFEGRRNTTLLSFAGALRDHGCSPLEIAIALKVANENRCRPPLPQPEIEQMVRSAEAWQAGFRSDLYLAGLLRAVSGNALKLASFLAISASFDGNLTPALSVIRRATGLSQSATSRAAKRLEELGLLSRKFRGPAATLYRLLVPKGALGTDAW